MTQVQNDSAALAGDLISGAEAIGSFFGLTGRQVFHLAAKGELPGAFKMGAKLFLSKSAARAAIAAKAAGGVPKNG